MVNVKALFELNQEWPGKETEDYVRHTLSRVTIVGTILLIILAIIFLVFNHKTPVNNTIDNPNGNIVEQPVDKKLYIEVN